MVAASLVGTFFFVYDCLLSRENHWFLSAPRVRRLGEVGTGGELRHWGSGLADHFSAIPLLCIRDTVGCLAAFIYYFNACLYN